MTDGRNKKLQLKDECNNIYDTDEILWLLKGNENLSAYEFVCKCILNLNPKSIFDIFDIFEYVEEE